MQDAGILAILLAFSIPLFAIGTAMVKSVLTSQERRLEMRLKLKQGIDTETKAQIDALRAEIANLRDTSTQFDLSLEHTQQRLEGRVQELEKGRRAYPTVSTKDEESAKQVIGG